MSICRILSLTWHRRNGTDAKPVPHIYKPAPTIRWCCVGKAEAAFGDSPAEAYQNWAKHALRLV